MLNHMHMFVGRSAVGRYDLLLLVIYRGLVLCGYQW
jgi:hypothetical protein